tara:strand:+ start:1652 stop:2173 length:522 start_codon:yes stop_codon:yes gene_type:complete
MLYLGWWLLDQLSRLIQVSNPAVSAAIVAGLVATSLALFTFWKERSRSIKEAHREKKIEIYQSFINMTFASIVRSINKESDEEYFASTEFMTEMISFKKDLLVYGSPTVIKAFVEFMNLSRSGNDNTMATLNAIGKIFLEVRKDIGLSNFGLDASDLHKLYVTDYGRTEKARQ